MIEVSFAGDREATAPLTWGQRSMWNAIQQIAPGDNLMNVGRQLVVPARCRLEPPAVAAALGQLIERHESLRTLIRPGTPEAGREEPAQVLVRTGQLGVEVLHCEPADAAALAVETEKRLFATRFGYASEFPIRAALVVAGGRVDRVVLMFCHIATDGPGADVVVRDLRLLLVRGQLGPRTAPQPLDLARWQGSVEGLERTRASLSYWSELFRRIPPTMLAPAGPVQVPRHQRARLTSAALQAASGIVAARLRVSTGTVLLAATVALIAERTGHPTVAISMVINNRFQPDHHDVVSNLAQLGLLAVDVDDAPPFPELVLRVRQAALPGTRQAYHDPTVVDPALDAIGRERGTPIHPYCCFNDGRLAGDAAAVGAVGVVPTVAAMRAALPSTSVTWPGHPERMHCRFCMEVYSEPGAVVLSVTADTEYLPHDEIERFLRACERLVVTAAEGPDNHPAGD